MIWKEDKQSRRFCQLLWQSGLEGFTWRQIGPPPWRWAWRKTLSDKTQSDTENVGWHTCQDAQRKKINWVFLAFIKVCQGRKQLYFGATPRDLFVNVTTVKSSTTAPQWKLHVLWNRENQQMSNQTINCYWDLFHFRVFSSLGVFGGSLRLEFSPKFFL